MIGKLLGSVITDVLIGKGVGKLGEVLKATKTGAALIEKAEKLKLATTVKVAEVFSNEAASAARQRLLKAFPVNGQPLVVLPGAPLSAKVIADFGVMVGNKIGKGVTSFRIIVKELSEEVGDAVKPHLKELAEAYRQQMKRLGLKPNEDEIISIFKEWEVERAKNINDSLQISKSSEIGRGGWIERKPFRDALNRASIAYPDKHVKAITIEEAKKFSNTGTKSSQFLPTLKGKEQVANLYKEAVNKAIDNGTFLFDESKKTYYFFHKFDNPIGYNLGKETNWIRVELSSGKIHGHPTNLETVRKAFPAIKGEKGK